MSMIRGGKKNTGLGHSGDSVAAEDVRQLPPKGLFDVPGFPMISAAEQRVRHAQLMSAANPDNQSMLCGLANCLLKAGRVDEAEAHYRKSMALGPHVGTLVNCACLLLNQRGKTDDASELFKKALEADPTNPSALNNYAHILCKVGRACVCMLVCAHLCVRESMDD